MKLFDVYPLFDLQPVKGDGIYIYDQNDQAYLDLYGGHAVISVGHSHPHYVNKIRDQLQKIGFYSNSVINPLQVELADKLGKLSGYESYQLFLCNSGAEANENALKLASFVTGRKGIIAFKNSFHGRTSAAVASTDSPAIQAPVNKNHQVKFLHLNELNALETALSTLSYCAMIIEGIQGIGGVIFPDDRFLQEASLLCEKYGTMLILDEIQSGYGRSGKFFAHQYSGVKPDIITMAKGMGNGFPVGGVAIKPEISPHYGMLGTTFGGSYLACAACLAVLEIINDENLVHNAAEIGSWWIGELNKLAGIKTVRGRGLMIALEFDFPVKDLRQFLLFENKIVTGSAKDPNVLRLLPPLNINKDHIRKFNDALVRQLTKKYITNPPID